MFEDYLKLHAVNTRRWPRYPVRLPVILAVQSGAEEVTVPGLVSAVSRSGLEVYGGVDLRPGDRMQVEFQTPGELRVQGVVRNRSGFCFGVEMDSLQLEADPIPDEAEWHALESLITQRHDEFLRQAQQNINQSLHMALEIRKFRAEIELFARQEIPRR